MPDSSPPKEVYRLKKELREQTQAALEQRFSSLEKELEEVKMMAEVPHDCEKDETFQNIKETFASGSEQFNLIHAKLDKGSRVKFWSIAGFLMAVVMASLTAVYSYARNETNWEYTTERVQKVETSVKNIDKNVDGIIVSFRLMEQSNTAMKEQLEKVSPENIEQAVFRGIKKAEK